MRAVAKYGAVASLSSLVLSALVLAPAGGATATTAQSHATIAESHGTAVAAGRAAAAGISFGRCPTSEMLPDSIQCGTVKVPLDYARPAGKQIELTVSRGRATGKPAEHQGAFVYNPGGPGASSMYFPMVSRLPEWERIARAYDIVGYSPRGVGRSAPLSCQNPADFTRAPTLAPVHPSPSYKQERIARAKAYAQGCARNAGPALRHYTSLNNARDLDVLRAALKQKQLTFMGASYGTYFGALYATLFPSHVRRMVFDSAVNPDARGIWYRSNLAQSYAFESRWADFRAWAAKHDRTYDLGATPEEVSRSYEKARAALAHKPAGGKVGPGQLHAAFLATGYSDDFWVPRATALSEYLKGNEKPLIDQAAPDPAGARNAENGNAVYTAVLCNDAPWPTEWEVWDRDHSELALLAPFETWDNAFMNLPCAYWPAPRQQPLEVRTKRGALPPTLILAAERDAATPYEGARELARRLKGAVLITERDAGTHGIGGGANECVNSYLEDYLLRGETPVRRAECAPHPEPDPVSLDRRAASPRLPRAV
ncbi:alpha/beta hydrolase [Streptomyces lunaelactis]|uniref:alpha/beta hydrolase n=1 Tax=Streptomyces lunaelactis TaxID=1535768 RepID=UPI001585943D|nr:alpha/beta hydrolase [Streptomyces lunaelactis]NUK20361.1 alpha/beta fold hydrolase [Streptomyces lunaelactis]